MHRQFFADKHHAGARGVTRTQAISDHDKSRPDCGGCVDASQVAADAAIGAIDVAAAVRPIDAAAGDTLVVLVKAVVIDKAALGGAAVAVEAQATKPTLAVGATGGTLVAAHGFDVDIAKKIGIETVAVGAASGEIGATASLTKPRFVVAVDALRAIGNGARSVHTDTAAQAGEVSQATLLAASVHAQLQADAAQRQTAVVVDKAGITTDVVNAQLVGAAVVVQAQLTIGARPVDADTGAAL